MHLRNSAEISIQTFKDLFIDGLCSTEPKYPSQKWDRLHPQTTMTLNMLRTPRTKPKLSAYIAIFGMYDFNRHPLAPPGTKLIVYKNTDNHWSWSPHVMYGCYIGPSMEHYRFSKCFMPARSSIINV